MNPKTLEDNIIYQAAEVTRTFNANMQQRFKAAGFDITTEQFTILTHLWFENGLTQQEIAQRTGRDKTTISRVLTNMIKGRLVAKESHPQDGRSYLIKLTPFGVKIQDQLVHISGSLFHHSLVDIEVSQIKVALKVLNRMLKNLE